jgi:hypothetical protein
MLMMVWTDEPFFTVSAPEAALKPYEGVPAAEEFAMAAKSP